MIQARIVGNVTPAHCHAGITGTRILLCEVLDQEGNGTKRIVGACDWLGAGIGSKVLVNADGDAVQRFLPNPKVPLRNVVMGFIDETDNREIRKG